MLISETVEIKWHPRYRGYYENKNYVFTKYGDIFEVNIADLQLKSNVKVQIKCDYCLKVFDRGYYQHAIRSIDLIDKDACSNCSPRKMRETLELIKGANHPLKIESVKEKVISSKRHSYEYISNEFKENGLKLLSTEYKNNKTALEYVCLEHIKEGTQKATYDYLKEKNGDICKYCVIEKRHERMKNKYKTIIEERDFIFVDIVFNKNNKIVINLICPNHIEKGIQKISTQSLKKCCGCKYCGIKSNANARKNDANKILEVFEMRNYMLLNVEDYKNSNTELQYICLVHQEEGIQISNFANVRNGKTCNICKHLHLKGENNYSWKGGISPLQNYMRERILQWKKDSLKFYDYKCVVTGESNVNLVVHHLYSFSNILDETLDQLNMARLSQVNEYTCEQLELIEKTMLENHYKYGYGVPLIPSVHDEFHKKFGKGNNTPIQFESFKLKYIDNTQEIGVI